MSNYRRRLLGSVSGRPNLPSGYTAYDWIQSDGRAWLNTDVSAEPYGYSIKVEFELDSLSNSSAYMLGLNLIGSYYGDTAKISIAGGTLAFTYLGGVQYINSGNQVVANSKYRLEIYFNNSNEQVARIIDLSSGSQLGSDCIFNDSTAWTYNGSLLLYKVITSQTDTIVSNCRIYKVEVNSSLSGNHIFYPCTDSNSVKGMYDVVNDVFKSNAGSGSFTVGNN